MMLLKNDSMLFTDSGRMHKRDFWLHLKCVTLREETERVEMIEIRWNVLYGDYGGNNQ